MHNFNREKFNIVSLVLQETGTYQRQHTRPYEAVIRQEALDNLNNRIANTIRAETVGDVKQTLVSGLANGLISVSATPEREAHIVNGWAERRFRFTMIVESNTGLGTDLFYFQGYSEFFDISYGDCIDPNMIFYINSYTRIRRQSDPLNPVGGYVDRVVESRQVLNGRYAGNNEDLYGIRPEDLFVGVQSSYMQDAVSENYSGNRYYDTRDRLNTSTFSNRRSNAIPSDMLSNIINTWRNVQVTADFGTGGENIYDRAIQVVHEKSPSECGFIRELSHLQGLASTATTNFTLNELKEIDHDIAKKTHYQPTENGYGLSYAEEGSDWGGSTRSAQIAATLSNAVLALMMECGLVTVHFMASNMMTYDGSLYLKMTDTGLTRSNVNQAGAYEHFLYRFKTEIFPDISFNDEIPLTISLSSNIYNETVVDVTIDIDPTEHYVYPSFADSLLQPTMTMDKHIYHDMVTGVEHILNSCGIDSNCRAINEPLDI